MASRFLAPFLMLVLQAAVPGVLAQQMALALGSGNAAYGGEYAPPTVHVAGGIATVSGVVKTSGNPTIAVLPVGARPKTRMIFTVWALQSAVRVDILPDGRIMYIMGRGMGDYISLSGISFPTN
jgi:hypothetical protein